MLETDATTEFKVRPQDYLLNLPWMMPVLLAVLLIIISFQNYLLFHVLAELFAIIIGVLLFVIAWQTFPFSRNHYLMFLACGYFWLGSMDLVHTLVYQGMKIFPVNDANLAPQLWIGTRYSEAIMLLSAPLFLVYKINRRPVFGLFGIIATVLCALVLTGNFPDAWVVGKGLTPFKVISEYVIIALLGGALLHLYMRRSLLSPQVYYLLTLSIILTMGSELAFTFYVSMYGFSNLVGHIFKLFSFWLVFIAIIKTSLSEPYLALQDDIAQRIKAEQELETTKHYLRNIIDSMPSTLIGIDPEGKVTHWNQEAEKLNKIPEAEASGRTLDQVLPYFSDEVPKIFNAAKGKRPLELLKIPYAKGGQTRYSDIMVYPLIANATEGTVIRIDDVTERVRMEEMMVQTEKMLSVGGLAAGMAHEINNPLSGMLQGLQNIRRRLSPDFPKNREASEALGIDLEKLDSYLEKRKIKLFMDGIAEAGERAGNIVSNMLQFSRKSEMKKLPVDLLPLIDKTLELAAVDYDLKKKYDFRSIKIVRELDDTLPSVPCIATEIQQVLLNILGNAAQALHEETERTAPALITLRLFRDGSMARVEIEDNGPGMLENIRNRVFEPFFTTKPPGQGTGLGLSVSYFIVCEEHHGRMSVKSQPGKGAVFTFWIPLEGAD